MTTSCKMMRLRVAWVIRNSTLTHWLLRLTIARQAVLWILKNTFNKASLLSKSMKITICHLASNSCRIWFTIRRWEFSIRLLATWSRFHSSKNSNSLSWLRARMKILPSKTTIAASSQQIKVSTGKMFLLRAQIMLLWLLYQTRSLR